MDQSQRQPIVTYQKAVHRQLQLLDTSCDLICMLVCVENAGASSLSCDLLQDFCNLIDRSVNPRERWSRRRKDMQVTSQLTQPETLYADRARAGMIQRLAVGPEAC